MTISAAQNDPTDSEILTAVVDGYVDALAAIALIREIADEYLRDTHREHADCECEKHSARADQQDQLPIVHDE